MPLNKLTKIHVQKLIDDEYHESQELEFKRTLPANQGKQDPWIAGENKIGDKARNELLEEIIAFANSYGGTLVIGMSETEEKPPRAEKVNTIHRCVELAERLLMQCRDCIEPKIPILEACGIPFSENGDGVLLVQIGASRLAPHRHMITKECYIRRADRTEKMTMREIQDLTIFTKSGLGFIEESFTKRRIAYENEFETFQCVASNKYGLRVTLLPTTPIFVEKVYQNDLVKPSKTDFVAHIGNEEYKLILPLNTPSYRPVVRGISGVKQTEHLKHVIEMYCDGLIEYRSIDSEPDDNWRLNPNWILGLLANAIKTANNFREASNTPGVEYAMEFEIIIKGKPIPIGEYGDQSRGKMYGSIPEGTTVFPRYSVGPMDEFVKLMQLIEQDFWHCAGQDWSSDNKIVVKF